MEYNAKFEAEARGLSEAERFHLADWYGEGSWYISEKFPRLFAKSALTMI